MASSVKTIVIKRVEWIAVLIDGFTERDLIETLFQRSERQGNGEQTREGLQVRFICCVPLCTGRGKGEVRESYLDYVQYELLIRINYIYGTFFNGVEIAAGLQNALSPLFIRCAWWVVLHRLWEINRKII